MIGNIFGNHRPCADEGVTPDGMAADDCAVCPQGCAFFDEGGTHLVHLGNLRPGVVDVGKNHGRSAEDTVFQSDTFVNADVVLNLAIVPDNHPVGNKYVLTDITILPNERTGANMSPVPDTGSCADASAVVHAGGFVDDWFGHCVFLLGFFIQISEIRCRKSDIRGQRSEVGDRISEIRSLLFCQKGGWVIEHGSQHGAYFSAFLREAFMLFTG